jgi:hypothetical protein
MEPSPCIPPCPELSKDTKNMKHLGSVDLITTKQTTFIDRSYNAPELFAQGLLLIFIVVQPFTQLALCSSFGVQLVA